MVNVTPDRALIQLGVQSNDLTPRMVEAANSKTINKITQALKALEIDEKDIVTDWYVIDPVYDSYNSLYIKGYRIDNIVAVTLRDITQVNQVIIAALDAGANQVVNVEFYLSDLRNTATRRVKWRCRPPRKRRTIWRGGGRSRNRLRDEH